MLRFIIFIKTTFKLQEDCSPQQEFQKNDVTTDKSNEISVQQELSEIDDTAQKKKRKKAYVPHVKSLKHKMPGAESLKKTQYSKSLVSIKYFSFFSSFKDNFLLLILTFSESHDQIISDIILIKYS